MTAGRHANPDGERAPYDWQPWTWPIGAVAAALGLTALLFAATAVAPKVTVAAQTTPSQRAEAVRGVPTWSTAAIPSIGAQPVPDYQPSTTTERNRPSWPHAASASGLGPVSPKPTAPPVTTTSAPSRASTVTGAPVSVKTPQESPREPVGASSGTPTDPSVAPGSSTATESTPSTPPASQPEPTPSETPNTTPPEPTATETPDLGDVIDELTGQNEETE